MKLIYCVAFSLAASTGFSQQTRYLNDPELILKQAKEYYQQEYYSLAYPLFKDLNRQLREADRSNNALHYQEIKYYTIVCALKQNESSAVSAAKEFINVQDNAARVSMMNFHLGEYYFRQRDYTAATLSYELASIQQLTNNEIADMKFHQGYSYFYLQQFEKAKPLFNDIRQLPDNPNYLAASYYYGFIAFKDKEYQEALAAFKLVENHPSYSSITPFYIATIYYYTGEKEKALQYAEGKLKTPGQYYDLELRQLVGHAYFEKKDYSKALPYLQAYVSKATKVNREDLYELSYAQYETGDYTKAIDGFKQLGGTEDSLAQNSMYLLADAYLKTDQKTNARNAFLFCASNSSNENQKEISSFNYAKLSYELGYQDVALTSLQRFIASYPSSLYLNEAKELLVGVLANTNNYKDALALLESLKDLSENGKRLYPRVLYGRATELINDGLLIGAGDLLDKALRAPYNKEILPFANFWKGEIAFRLERTDDAMRYYLEYLKTAVSNGEVNPSNAKYNLAYCFFRKENYRQAQPLFEEVAKAPNLRSNTVQQDAYVRAADCYYMNKDFRKALAMYDQVLNLSWPASDYAIFQKAMVAGVTSGSEKIKLLQSVQRIYPSSSLLPDANLEIANTYLASEKFNDATSYLRNVINSTGDNESLKPKAYLKLGIAYYNLDNNKEALKQYNELIKQYPNSAEAEDAFENMRDIYVEEGKTSDYVAFARSIGKDVSTQQQDSLAYAAAEAQFSNGNFDNALAKFEEYLVDHPEGKYSLDALYYKSEIYNNRKDVKRAAAGYEQVADRVPNKFGEKALLLSARLNFFDLKDYEKAERYFTKLKDFSTSQENTLEAMRGLLRSQFQLMKWPEAAENARALLDKKGSSTDDKVLANYALAKAAQTNDKCEEAITYYKAVTALNKASYGTEARYEIAHCLFMQDKLKEAEKAAFEIVNKGGSYPEWITRSYILLGDIYFKGKDYFNAKATYQSVVENATIQELKAEAKEKLQKAIDEEKQGSKLQ